MKYLVEVTQWFFDRKGYSDEGSVHYIVLTNGLVNMLHASNKNFPYRVINYLDDSNLTEKEFEAIIDEEGWEEEDCHAFCSDNLQLHTFRVKEITEEEAIRAEKIIHEYHNLM